MHKSILKSWEKANGKENDQVHNNFSVRFYRAETLSCSRQRKHSREKSNVLIWEQEVEKRNLKAIQACKLTEFIRK